MARAMLYAALMQPAAATLYAVTIANEQVPVTYVTQAVDKGKMVPATDAWGGGGVGQATGAFTGDSLYLLTGQKVDDTTLQYRVEDHDLATGAMTGYYPVDIPFMPAQYTDFGMQMGYDDVLNVAVVLAPSNASQYAPPFDYALTKVDLAANTTSTLATWQAVDEFTGISPIFEGFPATVDTKRHAFWTIVGLYDTQIGGSVRTLLGVDLTDGSIVCSQVLDAPPSLLTFAYDATTDTIYGVGTADASGTLALVSIDLDTHEVAYVAQDALGGGWHANVLPALVAFDGANLVFPATKAGDDIWHVKLVTLPVDKDAEPSFTDDFCTMAGGSDKFTCPKLMGFATSQQNVAV